MAIGKKTTQISVNGKNYTITGDVGNVSISNGNIVISSGGNITVSTVDYPEVQTFSDDVPDGKTETVTGTNRKVNTNLVEGALEVSGTNADVIVENLNGILEVQGTNADVTVGHMGPNSFLTVSGTNADVWVKSAIIGSLVRVSGTNAQLRAPKEIADTSNCYGTNSKARFV